MEHDSLAAIETVPLLEHPIIRLETLILYQLRNTHSNVDGDLAARFKLNILAIQELGRLGLIGPDANPDHPGLAKNPPRWCWSAGLGVGNGHSLLVDFLSANGHLDFHMRELWKSLIIERSFFELAPILLREVVFGLKGWTAEETIKVIDESFWAGSGTRMPVRGSDLYQHCKDHPEDPRCWVAEQSFAVPRARGMASELAFVFSLYKHDFINPEQTRVIFDVFYKGLTVHRGLSDIDLAAGVVIVESNVRDRKLVSTMTASMAKPEVGYFEAGSHWEEICSQPNPSLPCLVMRNFPVAVRVVDQFVKANILEEKAVQGMWNLLGKVLGGGPRQVDS